MSYKWYGDRAKKLINDVVLRGITGMAADSVKQAKSNANQAPPLHPQVQSGTLRRAITMDVDASKLEAKVGIMQGKEEGDEALEYAESLELGNERHPPYPYLYPAVELITNNPRGYFK